jgi:hypothetical protein
MASGFTIEQKRTLVLDSLFPMLKNDLHRVCDATCAEHGKPGHGPNFTAAMLCLAVCEVVGRLTSDPDLDEDAATVAFLHRVAKHSGDLRYQPGAKALFVYFRHSIAHSFMPKQPSTVRGKVDWAQWEGSTSGVCVDFLRAGTGATALAELRSRHLVVVGPAQGERTFVIVPQVLYLDVLGTIEALEQELQVGDQAAVQWFEAGFERWWGRAFSIRGQLDQAGRDHLGIS